MRVQHDYGRLPVHFEENRGQAPDSARFIARTASGRVLLTSDGLVVPVKDAPVRVSFAGGVPTPAIDGLDPLPGRINYYRGDDPAKWQTDVATYGRVRYGAVYPGIDVVVYGNQRQLEYDFLVAPGADPSRIRLAIDGASSVAIDAAGDLRLTTARGTLVQRKPVIYQDVDGLRVPIDGGYVVRGNGEIGLTVAAYDPTRLLVIDPVITYSTYLGSGGPDVIWGVAVDGAGNAYVAGHTNNFDAVAGNDPFPWNGISPPAGFSGTAGFVAKLNASGSSLVFASYTECQARAIALDAAGNIYVGGVTSSRTFATTAGSFQPTAPGTGENGCVLKLNPAGNAITWATYIGGPGSANQAVTALAVDSSGAVYVGGRTGSTGFPVTAGAPQATFGGGASDGFVAKLAPNGGALTYATYLGGTGTDSVNGLALDTSNQVFVTGQATTGFPATAGVLKPAIASSDPSDAFVTKLAASGSLVYSTFVGGSNTESANAIDIDAAGNAYVTGHTFSSDFPLVNAYSATPAGDWVLKLNTTGSALVYSTFLPQTSNAVGIAVDSSGAAYVAGATGSETFPQVNPIMTDKVCDPLNDCVYVTKLNPSGQVTSAEYSVIVGMGAGGAFAHGMTLDGAGNVYVVGRTGNGYTTTPGAYDTTHAAQDEFDGFVTKLSNGTGGGTGGGGGDTTPPTVRITSPSGNVWTGNSIGFSVTASDNVGLVSIKLWGNGAVFATLNCSGATCSGNTGWITGPLPPAAYQVHAVALDTAGNQTLSTPVTIFKDATSPLVPSGATAGGGGGTTPPPALGASIGSPANGATVSGTAVAVSMSATNAQGSPISFVLKVDNGATIFNQSGSSAAATTTWNTTGLSNGTHSLNLTVTDGAGRTASATTSVTVNNTTGGGTGGGGGDTTPPTVRITSPSGNVWTGNSIGFSVTASDNVGLVSIKLWGNGAVFATVNCSGTTCSGNTGWVTGPLPPAAYQVHAVALDTAGNQTLSSPVTIFKDATSPLVPSGASGGTAPPPPPPSSLGAAITSPANGATVSGASVGLSMTSSNAQGSSTFVLKLDNGSTIFSQTVSGNTASTTWNTSGVANGPHTLNLTVTDGGGRTASAAISVTVSNTTGGGGGGDTTAPTVSITSPSNGAWTGNSIGVKASASDNIGVATLTFYGNGSQFGQVQCPGTAACNGEYWWLTGSLPSGQHTITVVATDTAGNTKTSAPVVINK